MFSDKRSGIMQYFGLSDKQQNLIKDIFAHLSCHHLQNPQFIENIN